MDGTRYRDVSLHGRRLTAAIFCRFDGILSAIAAVLNSINSETVCTVGSELLHLMAFKVIAIKRIR